MHRRMRLGLGSTLLLLMFLAGPGAAFAGPLAASEASAPEASAPEAASAVESFDLLDWVWGWIVALAGGNGTPDTGGEHVSGSEGGVFIDPLGSNG